MLLVGLHSSHRQETQQMAARFLDRQEAKKIIQRVVRPAAIGRLQPVDAELPERRLVTLSGRSAASIETDMRASILLAFALLPGLVGAGEDTCKTGEECSIAGVITIYRTPPAFTAVLQREPTCVPLALPDSIYAAYESWNGKKVLIRGEALPNSNSDDEVVTFKRRGRNVTAAICGASTFIVFVNEISIAE